MNRLFRNLILISGFCLGALLVMGLKPAGNKVVNDFALLNIDGKIVSLKDYPDAKGFIIVFTCNHCPVARLYPARCSAMNRKYTSLNVPLIAISSTDTLQFEEDTYSEMVAKARIHSYRFPYLYDGAQSVARNFSAQKTPHAFVIWKERDQWAVKYSGAIDDNAAEPEKVEVNFVEKAVDALLSGKPVEIKETKSIGCQIYFRI